MEEFIIEFVKSIILIILYIYNQVIQFFNAKYLKNNIFFLQSPYFASMFSGSWRETNEKVINVEITDPNITMNCKNILFKL